MLLSSGRVARMTRAASRSLLTMVLATTVPAVAAQAQTTARAAEARVSPFASNVDENGIALHGYDPVSYFTDQRPTLGLPAFQAMHEGATYRFASAAHRDAFLKTPARYIPQYGGYCALGVSGGGKYDIDPSAWRVENGKLYLNKNPSVQKAWLKDIPGYIVKADAKWPTILGDTPKPR